MIDLNLALDVNGGPEMPADVATLASKLPKLRIVINHAANLRIDGKTPPVKWREGMEAAAKHPNVFCKISALVEQTGQKQAPRDVKYYRPVLDKLWELFERTGSSSAATGRSRTAAHRTEPWWGSCRIISSPKGTNPQSSSSWTTHNRRTTGVPEERRRSKTPPAQDDRYSTWESAPVDRFIRTA